MQNSISKQYVTRRMASLFFNVFAVIFSYGQSAEPYVIKTDIGRFEVQETPKTNLKLEGDTPFMGKYFRLVQFYQLPTDAERKTWEQQGLHLVDYVSGNTYFAVIDTSFSLSNIASKIRALLTVSRGFKLETDLQVKGIPAHAKEGSNYRLTLSYYRTLNGVAVINALKAKGIQVGTHRDYSAQIDVVIPAAQWDAVIDLPYIQFVGAVEEAPVREENYSHRNTTGRSNFLNTGFNGLMFNGSGVVIAIGEDGLLSSLIDVKGRTEEVGTSTVVQSHKVGCAQNAGGAGNEDPQDRNNAWGATVLSANGSLNYATLYNTHQLRFTNHSFGFSISGGYDSAARNHDLRIVTHPNHLISYSSGNSGTDVGFAPYNFAGWSNITGQVKQNKNHVAIGALSPEDQITGFSSRGPMYDGRIIPQLVVEGSEGTSFASPKFVGQLAQIAQVYKTKNAGSEPPSSLLRAIMMNTADDLGNPGPDHIHGYGRPNLRRAYTMIDENRFSNGTVSNNQVVSQSITVPANTKQVRVMIVWPDVAAAVNANPAIVNNLNLSLRNPSNVTFNPWILDTTPNPANLSLPATRGIDAINTIEQVTVDDPQAGNWTIEISGANVPFGPQTYYLVYEFLMDELTVAYPLFNEKLIAGQEYQLRWDSYGSNDTFHLSYELNNSGNWVTIVAGYDATKRVYTWIAPQVNGVATVRFRVQRGSLTSTSQVNYISGTPDNLRVFKACNDVVTLKWSPVTGATSYKVYRLGAQYMEEVTSSITFQGNSAILTGQSTTANEYYAVSAVTGTFEGQRCLTITKTPGDLNCTGLSWTGIVSSDWFDTNNWASGMLPTASDAIQIPATAPNQPQINGAGAVCATITIDAGASLTMNSTTNYTLNVFGDWINNGNFVRGIGTVAFVNTAAYQEITGTSTTAFHFLQVNKGVTANVVEATSGISLNAPANPLLLTTGTFKLSSNSVITPFTSSSNIGSNAGFWLNGGTVNSGNLSLTINPGLLRISAGTFNVGTAVGNSITYLNGGTLILEGGVLNVAGRIAPNSGTSSGNFQLYGGEVNVGILGSTSTTRGLFEITGNCSYLVTEGTITLVRASSNAIADYINLSNNANVTGGTVKIGGASTPVNQTIRINSTVPFFNLEINGFNTPSAQLVTNAINVKNNVSNMGGTLASNNLNISIQGNWLNQGSFTSGNASVVFNGLLPQSISGTTMTTFNNVQVNNPTGLSIQTPQNASVNGILQLTNGVISTGSNVLVITSNGSINRTLGHVNGNLRKSFSTTATTQLFEVGDAVMANYTPASLTFNGITNSGTITVSTEPTDFAQISSSSLQVNRSVNRNWSVSGSGLTFSNYAAVLTFLTTDLDGLTNTAALQGGVYSGATWNYPSPGVRNASSTELVGITTLGTLQLAENCVDTSSTENQTACGSYTWPLNNVTYTTSGVYTVITPLSSGCSHTTTLNLTVSSNVTYYQDADNDGFGTSAVTAISCTGAPVGYVANNTDCNDANAAIFVNGTFYVDADGDGFGASTAAPSTVCVANASIAPAGFSLNNGDCDDTRANVRPGAVDVCYDGIDNDCNGNIDNLGLPGGCTPIVSAIPTATCGTEVAFGGIVYSNWVTGAQGYRFRVTEVNPADDTEIPGTQVTVDMVLRNLYLHNLSNYKYNAKFKVEIAVRFNNVWQPNFSAPCFLLTPTPVSSMIGCGTQVTGINTQIFSTIVQRSNGYRYRVQRLDSSLQPAGPVQEITSGIRNFTFASVTDFRYDANYSVSCAVRNTDGSFLPYGPSCTIQAPKHPTTQVRGTQCNDYAVTSYSERIFADAVQFAAQYRFRLFNEVQVYDFQVDRVLNNFRLSDFPGLVHGETYSVQVAVRMPNQLDFGPYSKTCTLVIPTIPRTIEDTSVAAVAFDAQVYPNPFAEQFYFKVATASQASFTIQVYDMMGRAIETRTVNADAIESTEVGANYPAGVYHVILKQGENTKALRVIKR